MWLFGPWDHVFDFESFLLGVPKKGNELQKSFVFKQGIHFLQLICRNVLSPLPQKT